MSGLLKVKNNIRNVFRKYDEAITPVLRFVWALIVFFCLNSLFGFSDLTSKVAVIILLAILTSLLADGFMFFFASVFVAVNCFAVSLEMGAVATLMLIVMYCAYIRFFPNYAYAVLLTIVCFALHVPYAAPVIVGVIAGFGGVVPVMFGTVFFYLSKVAVEIRTLLATGIEENEIKAIKRISDAVIGSKELYAAMTIVCVAALATAIIKSLSFKYSMYISIAVGTVTTVLMGPVAAGIFKADVSIAEVAVGAVLGLVVGFIVRLCMGLMDYGHVEHVQYEDDEYYYYVKAVPKVDAEKPDKPRKRRASEILRESIVPEDQEGRPIKRPARRPANGEHPANRRPQGTNRRPQGQRPNGSRPAAASRPANRRPQAPKKRNNEVDE